MTVRGRRTPVGGHRSSLLSVASDYPDASGDVERLLLHVSRRSDKPLGPRSCSFLILDARRFRPATESNDMSAAVRCGGRSRGDPGGRVRADRQLREPVGGAAGRRGGAGRRPFTLDEAPAAELARVTEVSDEGQVSQLRRRHRRTTRPAARRQRRAGRRRNPPRREPHHPLPPGRRTGQPVSAVEAGRWSRSREFRIVDAGAVRRGACRAHPPGDWSQMLHVGRPPGRTRARCGDLIAEKSARIMTWSATSAINGRVRRHAA